MDDIKALAKQSWPIFLSHLAVTLFGVVDTIFASQLSPDSLVVVSVSSNIYSTIYITFSSVLYILTPYISQLFGAKKNKEMIDVLQQGVWLSLILCVPIIFLLLFPDPFLNIANLSTNHIDSIRNYLAITIISIPAIMILRVYFCFCTSTLRPTYVMHLNFAGLTFKIVLSYLLIHGMFGMPKLNIYGCAISTVIVSWMTLLISILIMKKDVAHGGKLFFKKFPVPNFGYLIELITKGFPIGLTFFIDFTSLTFIGLLIARMGDIITGGYQIASSISLLCYLFPLSIGSAASVLVARSVGVSDFEKTQRIRNAALFLTSAVSLSICIVLVFLSHKLSLIYTNNPELIEVSSSLIQLVAGYHFFDSLLTVISGLLRGYKKTSFPTVIYGINLWLFGLGGGYYFAFLRGVGAAGFWYGLTFAAFVASLCLIIYLLRVEASQPSN